MNAAELLTQAAELVGGERFRQYGDPPNSLGLVAALWSAYLGTPVQAADVALLMALLKIARARSGTPNIDHFRDLAGYAGLAGALVADGAAP